MAGDTHSLVRDLNYLVRAGNTDLDSLAINGAVPLPAPAVRAPIGAASGVGRISSSPSGGSSRAMVGDLTEADYNERAWHPVQTITSSDGFFVFEVRHLKSIVLTDGEGQPHTLNLADKP